MKAKSGLPRLRIDEHATYEPTPTRRRDKDNAWQDRKRQDRRIINGPSEMDETDDEREAALERIARERINPIFAAEYIDGYIRRCK